MSRFDVLLGDVVIGHTELEMGDPVNCRALGSLRPTSEYSSTQPMESSKLSVRLSGSEGEFLNGVVVIDDYSTDIGTNVIAIEVSVTGISQEKFRHFFPAHFAIYERQSNV
ncbi:hypothetical protein [Methylophilus sp. OH31]|uniref:hypothetical protein n=1 Tax=Methylophilus sp. OH31 TaxID=1387312 RepID=UPI0011DDD6B1|nr:hypothetical protein [Methylophilus sp. OH31]